jgi:hypothetical protein
MKHLGLPTSHGNDIYQAACKILKTFNLTGKEIRLVAVGVHGLTSGQQQIFPPLVNKKIQALDKAIDDINITYGEFTVRTGDILHQKAKESELHVDRENMTFHPAGGY